MKRSFRWLAAFLALVTVFLIPSNALASEEQGKYVSELAVAEAKSFDEAKEAFEKAGFEIVKESNLNRTLKTGVYLGYKTTDDAEEAIRDVAAMNMQGKYSYGDYKAIMESYKEQIRETIENFLPSLEEFQTNYDAEAPKALLAYEALNAYVDSDTGILMGDYFVDYDYSAVSEAEMTEKLMQANTEIVLSMMTTVMMGADTEASTLIDRLSSFGPDGLDEVYGGASLTRAQAKQKMAAEFGDTASEIRKQWNDLYQYLLATEKNLIVTDEAGKMLDVNEKGMETAVGTDAEGLSEEEKAYIETLCGLTEAMSETEKLAAVSRYALLSGTEDGDGTLLEHFMRPADEVEEEELYPLVFAMSEGQKGQIGMIGLGDILLAGGLDIEEGSAEAEEVCENAEKTVEHFEPTSIYENTDRSVYEEGVAFTSAATEHERQSGESWMGAFNGAPSEITYFNAGTITSWVMTAISLVSGIASAKKFIALTAPMKTLKYHIEQLERVVNNVVKPGARMPISEMINLPKEYGVNTHKRALEVAEARLTAYKEVNGNARSVAGIAMGVSFVIFLASLAYNIYTVVDYFGRQEPSEEAIPHHLLTALETEYGEDYVYYETVKDLLGNPADVNNHEGDKEIGWLVLYTTKEAAAGKPMLAKDLRVVTGRKNVDADSAFLHLFGETAALDVTSVIYTGTADPEDGTYVLFDRDASLAGSAVTGGVIAIVAL
ncbi:MAG: hypothetical protein MJ141_05125, partial [Clostridia bacterium]|nr:hypothetical protein [Clostridia bacterium]